MTDLRCPNTLQAVLDEGVLKIKCRNNRCGAKSGVVVMHYFDLASGELIATHKYRDPMKEVNNNGSGNSRVALRSA